MDVSLIAGKTEANLRRIAVTAPLGSEIFFYQANGANIAPSQETAAAAWNKHLITVPQNAVTAGINVPTGQTASVQFVVQTSADSYALVSLQPNDEFLVTAGDNTDAGDPQQALLPRAVFFSGTPSDLQHIETISEAAAAGWNNHRLQSPEGATYMGITVPDGQAATLKRILYNEIYDHFDLVSVTPGSDYLIYGDFEDDDPHPDNTNEGNGYIRFYSRSPSSGGQPTGDSLKPNRNIASNSNDPYRLTVPPNASQMAITLPSGKTISKIRKVLPNTYRIERYSFSGESQGNDTINATEATALNTTELSAFHSGGLAILQQDIDGSNPRIRRRLGQMSRPLGDLPDLGTGTAIKDFAYIGDNAVVVGYSNSAGDRSRIDLLVYDNGNNPTRHASAEFSGLLALAYRLGQPNTIFALRAAGTDIKIKRYSVVLQDSMESITESSAQESTLTMQQGANPSGNYQSLIVIETSSGDESLMTLKDNGRVDLWTADANGNYAIAQGADNKKNWTYDATTGFWHERSETTLLVCERSEGRNLVGGTENGMVSEYSIEHQNGDSVHEVVCPSIHANQQKLKFNRLQVQTGIFVEDEAHFEQNYPNFYAELESSDNGGHIWQKHGKVRIQQQMVWRALGQTQFGRNFRLLWKADRRVDILGAYISAQKGTN